MKKTLLVRKQILWHLIMLGISIIFSIPFLYTLLNAFKPIRLIQTYPPILFFEPTLRNFITAITKYHLHVNILNSLIISSGATVIGLWVGALSAYAISRFNQRGVAFFILTVMMIPYMVCLLPIYIIYMKLGLVDTFIGLIVAHLIITVPQSVWRLTGFIEGVPRAFEQAALVDGCSSFGAFWRIILPIIRPGLAATAIISFTLSWNNFNLALILSRVKTTTAPLGVYHFVSYESIDWGGLSAAVILLMIPALFFVIASEKHLVGGLIHGGLGGT